MAHQHHHDHSDHDFDWGARAAELEFEGELSLTWAGDALAWIAERIPAPAHILDLGCGPGVYTVALAQAFPDATLTAADNVPELLEHVRKRAAAHGVADRVDTTTVDLSADLSGLPEADLVWASRVLHHVPDYRASLAAITGRLRTGGVLAVAEGGLANTFLPAECGLGTPGLMSRVGSAIARAIADLGVARTHNWDVLLTEAGLHEARSRSFLIDLPAPVPDEVREWAVRRTTHAVEWVGPELDADDQEALRRLVDPGEPLGMQRRADLFVLGANTVHTAVR